MDKFGFRTVVDTLGSQFIYLLIFLSKSIKLHKSGNSTNNLKLRWVNIQDNMEMYLKQTHGK